MKKLFKLIGKNFKLLARSKSSALIIILGPLLIMLLAGLAFNNTNTYSMNIGVFSEDYTNLTESFIDNLKTEQFAVLRTITEQACINKVKEGHFHVCLVFPPNLSLSQSQNQLIFYVDYSKINLVWMVKNTITSKLSESSSKLSLNLTTSIIDKLQETETEMQDKDSIINALINKNEEITTELESLREKINTIDLSFSDNDFSTTSIASKNSQIDDLFESVEYYGINITDDITDLISDVESEINALNISSSEKESITTITTSIEANIVTLRNNITNKYNQSNNRSNQISSLISTLSQNLASLKSRLSTASSSKSTSLTKINTLEEKISSSKASLLALQTSISKIKTSLSTIISKDASTIVNPITTTIKPITTEKSHLNYFFPSLIALVIMFISILLASSLVMMEKTSKAHFRNNITPTNSTIFFFSTYLTCMAIMVFQLLVLFIISLLVFKIPIAIFSANFLTIILLSLLIATMFTLFGMFIGYLFRSRETATLGAVSLSSIMFIVSDLIIPLEGMSQHILQFAKLNPFIVSSTLLRKSILFGKNISSLGNDLFILLGYIAIFFVISLLLIEFFKRQHLLRLQLPRFTKKRVETKK